VLLLNYHSSGGINWQIQKEEHQNQKSECEGVTTLFQENPYRHAQAVQKGFYHTEFVLVAGTTKDGKSLK